MLHSLLSPATIWDQWQWSFKFAALSSLPLTHIPEAAMSRIYTLIGRHSPRETVHAAPALGIALLLLP